VVEHWHRGVDPEVSEVGMEVRTEEGSVRVGTEECFQHLAAGLRDPSVHVRLLAVCGLAASGDQRCVGLLVGALADEAVEVRTRAAFALGRVGDATAAPPLIEAARGEDPELHRAAITALGELGDIAVDELTRELAGAGPGDRVRIVMALGETRALRALDALTAALEDPDATVRARARESIEKIRETPVF
jgi:HEAT repeat protein